MLASDLICGAAAAGSYIGLTDRQVYHLTEQGHLPVIRKGKRLYYRKSDLEKCFSAAGTAAPEVQNSERSKFLEWLTSEELEVSISHNSSVEDVIYRIAEALMRGDDLIWHERRANRG
ncbi:helix-turn-helix domain-containing protein [Sphingobium phenoxybenzoativorans]|uniref:Helix-turn-helix domain-containing protein n=2 Tax=Sphingobium phenoxybenzoativorans TaxID=1592790 RepID=A0A975KBA5_9SPHN|nr:helix-turn-helix domain-containing protein [Sphingobium phenoxybenzoativorans]